MIKKSKAKTFHSEIEGQVKRHLLKWGSSFFLAYPATVNNGIKIEKTELPVVLNTENKVIELINPNNDLTNTDSNGAFRSALGKVRIEMMCPMIKMRERRNTNMANWMKIIYPFWHGRSIGHQ